MTGVLEMGGMSNTCHLRPALRERAASARMTTAVGAWQQSILGGKLPWRNLAVTGKNSEGRSLCRSPRSTGRGYGAPAQYSRSHHSHVARC